MCPRTHAKLSKIKNMHLIILKKLMYKMYITQVLKEYL
jgi:hypothetical protein